jgi:hypothetical protein
MALFRPPWGWSTGFLAIPRESDLTPNFLKKPALDLVLRCLSLKGIWFMEVVEYIENILCTPDGSFIKLVFVLRSNLVRKLFEPGL